MKYVIIVFISIWISVSFFCVAKPRQLFQSFHSLSALLAIDPEKLNDKQLKFIKAIGALALIFGIWILSLILNGRLIF